MTDGRAASARRRRRGLLAGLGAGVLALGALGAGAAVAADDQRAGTTPVQQEQQPRQDGDRDRDCPEKDGQGGGTEQGSGAQDGAGADVSL